MSIIQKIRDKYARWAVVAIALALLGFIMMDAFSGRGGSGGPGTTLGTVNGNDIEFQEFEQKVQQQEAQYASQGYQVSEEMRQGIRQGLWDQEITAAVLEEEYEELGLTITERELRDILYGENPPEFLRQAFTDSSGRFNAITAQQQINQLLKSGTAEQQQYINLSIEQAKEQRLMSKYMELMVNTVYYPKWMIEKQNAENSMVARFSYVAVPYTSIADSSVKVSDDEIRDYLEAHRDQFEQENETRSINYVSFSAAPSSADSIAVREELEKLKPAFTSSNDPGLFVNQQGSMLPYFEGYVSQNAIQVPNKDSILRIPTGSVYGPYLDENQQGGNSLYVLAKMVDNRILPDSVRARHILIGTIDPNTGQPNMSDSVAKQRIDSIAAAIRGGANFDTLETRFSTDLQAHQEKGVMTFSSTQIQSENFAKEFGQFILFDGKPGDKKVVKTQFGWHYIEIMNHINPTQHYKIAYLAKPVATSDETDNEALNRANLFAGDSRDVQSFNSNAQKLRSQGVNVFPADGINPMDFSISGMQGSARSFIKTVFDADKGDVLGPERIGQNYIVAVVTEVNEEGLMGINSARAMVEPILRNKKKAEMIIKNIGSYTSLEQVAAKTQQQVQTLDSVRFNQSAISFEPKLVGAVFNPDNRGKLVQQPVPGTQGVYVLRVDQVSTVPVEGADVQQQQQMMEMQSRQRLMQGMQQGYNPIIEPLKSSAEVKDRRSKFY